MKKNTEILYAIYNDKEILKKIRKSMNEYAINLRSMEQLKQDSKDIEAHIKEKYKLTPTLFKKIVKASLQQEKDIDDLIDEIQLIRDIAQENE